MVSEKLPRSPYESANIISKLFFWWMNSIFFEGNKRDLGVKDLYRTLEQDRSDTLGDKLTKSWDQELEKCKAKGVNETGGKNVKPSLRRTIIRQFGAYYMTVGLLALVEECATRVAQPICLGYLIRYFSGDEFTKGQGWMFASGVVLGSALYTFTHHPYFFAVQHVGMQIRIACCSLIYRKSLRLSQASLGKTTIGQMVNLLSNDVNRFDQSTIFIHYLWVGPIQTVIVTVILWDFFGPSCLVGLCVLILFVPFQGYMGRLFSTLRSQTAVRTDKRIRIMNEIVSGMRVIKMYTWEKPFSALVGQSREDEVKIIRKTSHLRAINMSLFYTSSKLIIFLTLLVYVLTDNALTAEKVFVTLSLYNNVRLVMTLFFPNGVSQLAETLVSISRLEKFLMMEEKPEEHKTDKEKVDAKDEEKGIIVENLCAKWTPEYQENTLTDISLKVGPDELIAVIGHVGSGKGSLLHAILKELPASQGVIKVNGTIAYAAQEPWVFAGSVKQNILFGKTYQDDWYKKVIEACALKRDLELFPYADNTLVGDRGASLSGGQKARITLARAVYSNADIYLLDDPLSAVDAEVGRHLFEKCINGILSEKTRILVTHQLQFLKHVNHIILLDNGKIQSQGTYSDLIASGIDFAQLLQTDDNSQKGTPLAKRRVRTMSESSTKSTFSVKRHDSLVPGDGSLTGVFSHDQIEIEEEEEIVVEGLGEGNQDKLLEKRKDSVDAFPKAIEETKTSGNLDAGLYWSYFSAGSTGCFFFMLVLSNFITQALYTGSDYWLNFWTKLEEDKSLNRSKEYNTDDPFYTIYTDRDTQIYLYSGIIAALFVASMVRTLIFFQISMDASVNLHRSMFQGIIRAPMRFFELNPVGRILNRFTKDMGQMDDSLPPTFFDFIGIFLNVIGILVVIGVVNPYLLIPAAILSVLFYYLRRFYLQTARSVKRLEGIARSPVFSHLSTSLYGLTTIRAFKAEQEFAIQFDDHQDLHTASWYLFLASTRWFGIWLDWISVLFIAAVTFSFMVVSDEGAEVGLAVSSAMTLTGMFQWGVRQSAEVENQMVSVERVLEYTKLESELALESPPGKGPPPEWPPRGQIRMGNVQLKYGDDAPVLKDITCTIQPSEKVGIVGRTGAGKSSLITALFRIAEPTGIIEIDGINILKIGLHELRSKISIIPQDPVLYSGTLRKNLDPFQNYNDEEIWKILEEVHLAEDIRQLPPGLDVEIAEGGSNFSVGQRQLVCLGRAILRKNKILVLDEATANVDPETDALIQRTIRLKFVNCTVLTVAHRLHTVMDSDKIIVLDAGSIIEFEEPYKLMQDRLSSLYQLVQQTGSATAEQLFMIAKEASEKRRSPMKSSM